MNRFQSPAETIYREGGIHYDCQPERGKGILEVGGKIGPVPITYDDHAVLITKARLPQEAIYAGVASSEITLVFDDREWELNALIVEARQR